MKVALDTNPLYTTQAGIARYVWGLQAGLAEILPADITVDPWAWPVENLGYAQPARMAKTAWRELIWAHTVGKNQLRKRQADLLHSTALPLIARPPSRHVVTLHDLALLRYPERFRVWQRRSGLRRLRQVASADHIIAVSRFTADEAMALLDIPARKITVIHHGVTLAANEQVPANLPSEFFLFVGSLEPGKNLTLLKQVWCDTKQRGQALPPLVIVGARWVGVETEGAAPVDWIYLGRQSDEVLLALYRRARALLFPSLYEGFGLPVLEAMAAGCPVICGRTASLPEVGGDAVCYAELTIAGFLTAMEQFNRDDAVRKQWCDRGLARASGFAWERCARETLAVWRAASGG